jgi:hypothetical protein
LNIGFNNRIKKFVSIVVDNKLIDIVFVWIFCLLLFVPISNITLSEKSKHENRNLATYKPFIKDNWKVNYEFGKDGWLGIRLIEEKVELF